MSAPKFVESMIISKSSFHQTPSSLPLTASTQGSSQISSQILNRLKLEKNEIIQRFLLSHIYDERKVLRPGISIKPYTDSAKFEGQLNLQYQKHGKGIYYYSNGDVYVGEWLNDKFHGKGVYIFNMGERYEGDLQNGVTKKKEFQNKTKIKFIFNF